MSQIHEFHTGELSDDLRSLDAELSSIRYEERASFAPELRAELARAWADEPVRRRAVRRRHLAAAAMVALLLGGAAVPSARASFVRLIGALTPEAPVEALPDAYVPSALETAAEAIEPPSAPPEPETVLTTVAEAEDPAVSVALEPVRIAPQMLDREAALEMLQDAYPDALQLGRVGGTVRLRMRVDADGAVADPAVAQTSGVDELDRIAVALAPRFRFVPALQDGRPVATWIEFPVLFEPDPGRVSRSLDPVVDPLGLPIIDRVDWWQLSDPVDPGELPPAVVGVDSRALGEALAGLLDAIEDATLVERLGPVEAIVAGVAPGSANPTVWRAQVVAALEDALERGTETPVSLLALGRIRLRQGVRAEARRLFERGLQIVVRDETAAGAWVVAELHHERGKLVRDSWRASNDVGRVRAEAFSGLSCDAARSTGGSGTGFASVERLIVWNYLCPSQMRYVFEVGFERHESATADLTLMMASFRAALEAYPAHVGANTDFIVTLAGADRWEDVLRMARRFTRVTDGHPDGLLLAGMALHRLDRSAEAEPLLLEALSRMDPARADALRDVGVLLNAEDRDRYRRLPSDERRRWEEGYWSTKDRVRETAVNERRVEHLVRAAYAELALGGVLGDAGEVWIRFGGPETVHIVDGGSGRLTEFWDYGAGPDITFVRWVSSERTDLTPEGRAYVDDLGRAFSPE